MEHAGRGTAVGQSRITPLIVILAILLVATPAVVLSNRPSPTPRAEAETPVPPGFRMLFVGESSGLARGVLVEFVSRAAPLTMVSQAEELGPYADRIDGQWVVLFNSEWLRGRTQDPSLASFIGAILPSEVKIVAVGNSTSLLFEALQGVDAGIFAEDRNPAYDNPPLAGYRVREASAPDGTTYYGESILAGDTSDPLILVEVILVWR